MHELHWVLLWAAAPETELGSLQNAAKSPVWNLVQVVESLQSSVLHKKDGVDVHHFVKHMVT